MQDAFYQSVFLEGGKDEGELEWWNVDRRRETTEAIYAILGF